MGKRRDVVVGVTEEELSSPIPLRHKKPKTKPKSEATPLKIDEKKEKLGGQKEEKTKKIQEFQETVKASAEAKITRGVTEDTRDTKIKEREAKERIPEAIGKRITRLRSKRYKEVSPLVLGQVFDLDEALKILPQISLSKFDASVEVHLRLGLDSKKSDQKVKAVVDLPEGLGKERKIAVFCPASKAQEAKRAGAELVGEEDLVAKIEKGFLDFDLVIAVPESMPKIARIARILGPRGLMPDPKVETVTSNLPQTIKAFKTNRVIFSSDPQGIIHQIIGKVSFGPEKIKKNFLALLEAVLEAKPASIKKDYLKSISLCPTIGPALRLNVANILSQLTK